MSKVDSRCLVSVLIITYQQEAYIAETLESVIDQNFCDLQIVVSDDGSSDQTIAIVKRYVKKHPELIHLVESEKNTGITDNCNRGLFACKGKYLSVLGGDDVMLPNKLQIQSSYMEANPECAVSYHDMEVFNNNSGNVLHLFSSISKPRIGGIREIIRFGTVNCASSTMYRMSSVPKSGFRTELPVVSDWMFTIESLEAGGKLGYINEVLGRYRRHDKNVSGSESPLRMQGQSDLLSSCAICLTRYPGYLNDALFRLAGLFRESRNLGKGINYQNYLLASLKIQFSFKSVFGLLIFYASLKKIRI